jgi:multiple sugar transport system substrate-binding protein
MASTGRKTRRQVAAGVLALGVAAGLVACGGGDEPGAASNTLVFVTAQPDGTFDDAIASFEAANPGVVVEEQKVPFDDLNSTVLARVGAKDTGIDLIHVDEPRIASLAARGLLMDLSDMREQAAAAVPEGPLEVTTYDDKLYALPQWTSSQVLYYNKDLLEAAGVPLPSADPTSPTTWEDVVTQGAAAQAAGAQYGFTFDQVDRYYQVQALPEGLGGGPGLTGDDALAPDVTNQGWQDAMAWYGSVFASGVSPRGIDAEQTPDLFASGQVAFFAGGPWNVTRFPDVNYGVAPFPRFAAGEAATATDSWAVGISPFTEKAELAKEFAAYITLDAQGAKEASVRGNIPVQNEAFGAYRDYLVSESPENGALLADLVDYALANTSVSRPKTTGYVDFETIMNSTLSDIRNGADPGDRLSSASDEIERALAKFRS